MKNSSGEVIVDFCFRRAGRIILAASALLLVPSFVTVPSAKAQDAAAAQPNWKDRDEYDLFTKMSGTADMKARLDLLKTWEDKYPKTEFVTMRNQYFMDTYAHLAGTDPSQRQALLTKAQDVLKTNPKDPVTLFLVCIWGPITGGSSPSPDLVSQVDSAAHTLISNADQFFVDTAKPKGLSDDDWHKAKILRLAKAHQAIAWADISKKDFAGAESEYRESLTVYPDDAPTSSQFGKMLFEEKKYPEALFEYARAGQYSGPGATLPPAGRQQALDFFNKTYKNFHGGDDGKDQVLAQAKSSAVPPPGFTIVSAADLAQKDADAINKRIQSDPAFGLWYSLKANLTGDKGADYFAGNVKEYELPGGTPFGTPPSPVKDFTGTILSVEPADKPIKVTLGVEDPTKADATLIFTTPIPEAALTKIKVGEKIDFTGVVDSFNKDPYMLTFKDPEVAGVQLAPPPARKAAKKRR
jgi:tetratricopeptide (TPR) repeat protein